MRLDRLDVCNRRRISLWRIAPVLGALVVAPLAGQAAPVRGLPQPATATASPGPGSAVTPEAPDSPRASLRTFLDLTTRRGDYAAAARYLLLPPGDEGHGPQLARRLRAVLERRLDVDLDGVSAAPEGNSQDSLPPGVDTIGRIAEGRGGSEPLLMVRTQDERGAFWAFSRQTVGRIDGWYDALPGRWAREWLPERLQRFGPGDLMWWQWLALPALALVALAAGRLLGAATRGLLRRLTRHAPTEWDDRLLRRVSPGLTLLWAVAAAALLLPWLDLLPGAHASARTALSGFATFAIFWSLWRSVDVWTQFLMERPWAAESASSRSLLAMTRNLAKVGVAAGGVVATLAALGYPVVTVLAGLGIGGIALAFGAQKTIENLFGSIAIAADRPFRLGDFVRIEDFVGTVERIGMRSTQIRTPDRTLITLPNGRLADMRVEDFAARERIRFATTVGLVYGTSEAQLRLVLDGIERLLRSQEKIWPDVVVVKLAGLGPSSLDVELQCWYRTSDFDEFRRLRQDALLGILRVVDEAGTSLAFPTRTLHVTASAAVPLSAAGAAEDPQREA